MLENLFLWGGLMVGPGFPQRLPKWCMLSTDVDVDAKG